MPYTTDALLRDTNGMPGPQIYDTAGDAFVAFAGLSDGGPYVHEKPDGSGLVTTSFYASAALESAKQVKTGSGVLFSLSVYNSSSGALYLVVFDATTAPSTGAIPSLVPRAVAATSTLDLTPSMLTKWGWKFSTGLYVALSTTQATFTAEATAYAYFNAFYL